MTVATSGTGNAVGAWDPNEFDGDTGLEDVGAGDVVIPRLQILHADGKFKDNLSGAEFTQLDVIILGLVKQRIMWADEMEDGDKPLCKSPDDVHGFPNMRDDVTADKRFPWDESNFEPSNAQPIEIEPQPKYPQGWSSNGYGVLNCASCKFSKWGQDKNAKPKPPPCTEQHTYAVLYKNEHDAWTTALLTVQRTGIKPSRTYVSSFAQSRQPMFTVQTQLTLSQQSRGSVKYSVPIFKRMERTDNQLWGEFAEQYRTLREWLRAAPRRFEEGDEAEGGFKESSNANTAPAAQAQATTAPAATTTPQTPPPAPTPNPQPTPTPPPAAPEDDDDLPF